VPDTDVTTDGLDRDGTTSVSFSGELDLSRAAELRDSFALGEAFQAPVVQVDLTEVTFLDSSCIGVIVTACKHVRSAGGAFTVRCGTGAARKVLEISGLIDFLEVEDAA
jgi:anti-sigma B factor antagonist